MMDAAAHVAEILDSSSVRHSATGLNPGSERASASDFLPQYRVGLARSMGTRSGWVHVPRRVDIKLDAIAFGKSRR